MTAYIVHDCGWFFLHFLRFHWQEDVYLLLMQTILLSSLWCYHFEYHVLSFILNLHQHCNVM